MTSKRAIRLAVGISLAALFLWLVFRQVSLNELASTLHEVNSALMLAALIAFFLGYSCRIERWRLMLKHERSNLNWAGCAGPLMASVAANNVLPFRAGDLLRAFAFNRRLGITAATSVTSLLVERLLDLLMIVVLLGLALTYFGTGSSQLYLGVSGAFLIVGAAVISFVLLFPTAFAPMALALGRLVALAAPHFGQKLLEQIDKCFSALQQMAQGPTMIRLVFWSALAWLFEGFVFLFAALALPAIQSPAAAWMALPIGTLATVIPSTPGYVGTFDFFTVRAMTSFGNTTPAATAYALLVHALLWLPPTLVGGVYLLLKPINPQDQFAPRSS